MLPVPAPPALEPCPLLPEHPGDENRIPPALSETSVRLMLSLAYHEAWLRRTRRWGY